MNTTRITTRTKNAPQSAVTTNKKIYRLNEEIRVSYSNIPRVSPDRAYHLISIVRKRDNVKIGWLPIWEASERGEKTVAIEEPGDYEVHLIYDFGFDGGSYPTAFSSEIKVA
jgi:hypothetical protein